jgi:hypothetical protein
VGGDRHAGDTSLSTHIYHGVIVLGVAHASSLGGPEVAAVARGRLLGMMAGLRSGHRFVSLWTSGDSGSATSGTANVKDLIAAIRTFIDGWNDRCQRPVSDRHGRWQPVQQLS